MVDRLLEAKANTNAKLLSNTDSLANGGVNGTGPGTVQNWNNLSAEKSLASFDVAHRAVINYVLNLPVGRGKKFLGNVSGVADKVISGWAIKTVTLSGFTLPPYRIRMDSAASLPYFARTWARIAR